MSGGQAETNRPGGGKRLSELSGGLSGFEVDNEPLTRIDCQCEFALGKAQRSPRLADRLPEILTGANAAHLTDREYSGEIRKFASIFFPIGKISASSGWEFRNSYRSGNSVGRLDPA
jgi:hypothetical protein